MQCIIMENTLIKLTLHDEAKKRAHDSQIVKQQILREEVQYLLDHDFIEPSQSEWSSPYILVPKPDGTFRMCTGNGKVNSVTKTEHIFHPENG